MPGSVSVRPRRRICALPGAAALRYAPRMPHPAAKESGAEAEGYRMSQQRRPSYAPREALVPILLVLASAVLGLLVSEWGLRVAGFRYQTFPTVQFGWPQPAVIEEHYVPDRDLFWVPRDYRARLATARGAGVVFLGDSCTQFGTYPELVLHRLARDRPALATGVALGVAGWSSEQGRAQLVRDVLPLHPKVATIYFGWNDHWIALGPPDDQARPGRIAFWLSQNVRLAQLVTKARLAAETGPTGARPNRVSLERYRDNLTVMVRAARHAGIVPVLVTAPSNHLPGMEPEALATRHLRALAELIPQHRAYVEATRLVARDQAATLCDIAADFAALPAPIDRYFQTDGIHLSKVGDQALAALLAECIVRATDG